MVRWYLYLIAYLVMQVVAYLITPVLPMFRDVRLCKLNNAAHEGLGIKLVPWLSWFDTPDNDLRGDERWFKNHPDAGYWDMVAWLYRNSLYGFKWSVLSAPMDAAAREISGPSPTWSNPGFQRITMNGYWQWHLVKQIGPVTINWNFGWLINDGDQPRALFMFSPRVRFA